ncbi:DUF1707 domain-containing protein [Rhodococcus sp. NPDC047139]|uniref:DUF1707 SHOCT-like domain-containing protein n=1 Tax=Rhodococcus sp. NPDC047139 TaxID=3155141 RepID=UPI0033F28C74
MEYTSPAASPDPETPARAPLRISDAEREALVDELGRHLTAGRLTIAEFDERVARVYHATTRDDAATVLADLPSAPPAAPARSAGNPAPRLGPPLHQRLEWGAWVAAGSINLVVWAAVSLGSGSMVYFWPFWVIVPWGIVLAARSMLGIDGGRARRTVDDHALRAHRKQLRHAAVTHRRALPPHCARSSRTWC